MYTTCCGLPRGQPIAAMQLALESCPCFRGTSDNHLFFSSLQWKNDKTNRKKIHQWNAIPHITGNQQGAAQWQFLTNFLVRNFAWHGTFYLLHNQSLKIEERRKARQKENQWLVIATITSMATCVSMCLTIYTYSCMNSLQYTLPKMSKDFFFLPSCTGYRSWTTSSLSLIWCLIPTTLEEE